MATLTFGSHKYVVYSNEEEVREAFSKNCIEFLNEFNADFLHPYVNISLDTLETVLRQGTKKNAALFSLITDWEHFVDNAIATYGAESILAIEDGQAIDLETVSERENLDEEQWDEMVKELENQGITDVNLYTPAFQTE